MLVAAAVAAVAAAVAAVAAVAAAVAVAAAAAAALDGLGCGVAVDVHRGLRRTVLIHLMFRCERQGGAVIF